MNTTKSVSSPKNVTYPEPLDRRVSSSVTENITLEDFNDSDSYKFISQNTLHGNQINQKFFTERLEKEFSRLRENPSNPLVLNRIGAIYLANHKVDKAKNYFKKAFSQDIEYVDAARNLATAYLIDGKSDKAEGVLNLIISTNKVSPQVLHEAAIVKLVSGKYEEASAVLNRINDNYRLYFESTNTLGLVKLLEKNLKEAKKLFTKAASINPKYAPAFNNLAIVEQNVGNTQKAISAYRKALEINPDFVEAYGNLFQLYVSQNKYRDAERLIISAQHLALIEPEIAFKYGWILMQQSQYEEAIKKYENFLSLLPKNGNALNNIGFCYAQLRDYGNAVTKYEEATRYVKGHYLPHRNLLSLLVELGQNDRALNIAKQLLKVNKNDAIVLAATAAAYAGKDDWDKAKEYLFDAYKQKPPITYLYTLLGLYYADIELDFKKGEDALLYPLKNNLPSKEDAYNNLVHLYLVNNKVAKAKTYIKHLNLKHPIVMATDALYRLQNNKLEEALGLYDKAIDTAPEGIKRRIEQRKYFDLGCYYLRVKEKSKAKKNFEKSINIKGGYKYLQNRAIELLHSA